MTKEECRKLLPVSVITENSFGKTFVICKCTNFYKVSKALCSVFNETQAQIIWKFNDNIKKYKYTPHDVVFIIEAIAKIL